MQKCQKTQMRCADNSAIQMRGSGHFEDPNGERADNFGARRNVYSGVARATELTGRPLIS